jgi:hypothetical protein
MLKSIPWDVWAAVVAAVFVALLDVFDSKPVILTAAYLGLCAYVVVETISGENAG